MIQSLMKAHAILSAFTIERPNLTLSELSHATGYPKTTLYTLAATLVHMGYLEKDADRYALGSTIIELSPNVRVNVHIRDRAAPLLRGLAEELRGSVYLTVPKTDHVLYIYAIETTHRLQARSAIGGRAPFHSTSVGKAMLAFMEAEDVSSILQRTGLARITENTITDPAELTTELESIRTRGYAIDRSENESNIFCIGAPIFDERARVIASCSVSDTREAMITTELERASATIMTAAEEISRRMGYVPRRPGHPYGPSNATAALSSSLS
jgi:DNA-binding IclR family transcriptional regulator